MHKVHRSMRLGIQQNDDNRISDIVCYYIFFLCMRNSLDSKPKIGTHSGMASNEKKMQLNYNGNCWTTNDERWRIAEAKNWVLLLWLLLLESGISIYACSTYVEYVWKTAKCWVLTVLSIYDCYSCVWNDIDAKRNRLSARQLQLLCLYEKYCSLRSQTTQPMPNTRAFSFHEF